MRRRKPRADFPMATGIAEAEAQLSYLGAPHSKAASPKAKIIEKDDDVEQFPCLCVRHGL